MEADATTDEGTDTGDRATDGATDRATDRTPERLVDRSAEGPVRYAVHDGVATLTLARPAAMNSLDLATKEALLAAVRTAGADEGVRCVVLTGEGRAFCVGQDLREHAARLADAPGDALAATVTEHYNPLALALATMPKPVVAAVNGVAAGAGASLAFACDLRVLSDRASFTLAFAGVGLSCDTGASWTLPRLVGRARALELLLLPGPVPAERALELGLATRVVPHDELAGDVAELAARLAAGPTRAYAAAKDAVGFAAGHDLATALDHEAGLMAATGATADHRDAVAAFLAKRTPVFHGR